jgi:hypothetical protein
MGSPAAGHRLDARGTREQERAFHRSRILGAVRAAGELLAAMRHVSPGVYAVPPAVVLSARERVERALPYCNDEEGTIRL